MPENPKSANKTRGVANRLPPNGGRKWTGFQPVDARVVRDKKPTWEDRPEAGATDPYSLYATFAYSSIARLVLNWLPFIAIEQRITWAHIARSL